MQRRPLGDSGLTVGPICFGGNVFGWTVDERSSFALLDALVDAGIDFIDTADVYSRWAPGNVGGESEAILGRWFERSGQRDRVVLATKVGMDMGEGRVGLRATRIVAAVEASLARLRTDRIDLYQSHQDDAGTPLDETLAAFQQLVDQGKVRVVGASNYDAPRLAEALALAGAGRARYATLQPLYNLTDRAPYETALQAVCAEHGVATIPYFSLAMGFLSGKYRSAADASKSVRGPRIVERYLDARGLRILAELDALSAELGSNPARLSLAWLRAQPTVLAPIVSATSREQLADIVAAATLTLPPEALARLDAASATS